MLLIVESHTILVCRGFKSLLDLVNNTTNDSFELYYGLFMYNQVCMMIWSFRQTICTRQFYKMYHCY